MLSKSGKPPPKPPRKVVFPALPAVVLVNNLVDRGGLPRRIAAQWMQSPQMVVASQYFYFDCIEADSGDREARERVDYCRWQWEALRMAEEALGNNPDVGAVPFKLPSGHEVLIERDPRNPNHSVVRTKGISVPRKVAAERARRVGR